MTMPFWDWQSKDKRFFYFFCHIIFKEEISFITNSYVYLRLLQVADIKFYHIQSLVVKMVIWPSSLSQLIVQLISNLVMHISPLCFDFLNFAMVMHWTKLQNRLLTSLPWWIIYHQFKAGRLIYLLVNYICEMACLISDVIYSFYILYQIGVTFSLPIILLWCWYGKTKAKPCNSEGFLNFYWWVIYFLWTPSLYLLRFFFFQDIPLKRHLIQGLPLMVDTLIPIARK